MQEKRYRGASSLTKTGELLVTGGGDGGYTLSSTELFTSAGSWVSHTPLPIALSRHCQITVGEDIYVTGKYVYIYNYNYVIYKGGYSGGTSAKMYRLRNNAWVSLADMATARYAHSCAFFEEKIWVLSGTAGTSVENYDIVRNTWSSGPSLPSRVMYGQVQVFNTDLYLANPADGRVLKLENNAWVVVTTIGQFANHALFPAPVVNYLNC